MKIETIAVHGGYSADPTTKAVAVPIYQTTSYAFDDTQHGADLFDLKVISNTLNTINILVDDELIREAVALAKEAEVVVICVSGFSSTMPS